MATDLSSLPPPPVRPARRHRTRLVQGAVAVVAVAALGLPLVAVWRDVDRLEDRVGQVSGLERRADDAEEEAGALQDRIEALEQRAVESLDATAVAAAVAPSVFTIVAPLGGESVSLGTGFVFGKDGRRSLLVTNFHVVEERWRAGARDVVVSRGGRDYVGEIVRVNPASDLALVQVTADLPPLAPADGSVRIGDPVLVIGSSEGLEGTVTTGVVSAIDRLVSGGEWLQFSAQVNPGNSGGPVIDADGAVLGVATFKAVGVEVEGLSFAIPVSRVCSVLDLC